MPRVYVDIQNDKEVIRALKSLEDKGKSKLLEAAEAGAKFLQPKVRDAIPLGSEDNIHLRDNIKVVKGRQRTAKVQSASVEVGKRSADYGFHLETGTEHIEGRKFMRNTADKYAKEIADVVTEELAKSLGV